MDLFSILTDAIETIDVASKEKKLPFTTVLMQQESCFWPCRLSSQ